MNCMKLVFKGFRNKSSRYLRYKGIKAFGGGNSGCTSEITIFGTEADGSIIEDPETLTGVVEGWE